MFLCRTQGLEQASPKQDRLGSASSGSSPAPLWASLDPRQFVRDCVSYSTHMCTYTKMHADIHMQTHTRMCIRARQCGGGALYSDGVGIKHSLGQERGTCGPPGQVGVRECSVEEGWCGA